MSKKISELAELASADVVAADDLIAIVDASTGQTKYIRAASLLRGLAAGSAGTPAMAFALDPDTGFYNREANGLGVALGGNERWYFAAGGDLIGRTTSGNFIYNGYGSAAFPSYSFISDGDSGFYRSASDRVSLSLGGAEKIRMSATDFWLAGGQTLTVENGAKIGYGLGGSSESSLAYSSAGITFRAVGTSARFSMSASAFLPAVDNTYDLGSSALGFREVFADNGVINTSDARTKKDITDLALGLDFICALRPRQFRKIDGGGLEVQVGTRIVENTILVPGRETVVLKDGTEQIIETLVEQVVQVEEPVFERQVRAGRRIHSGFVAQEVRAVLPDGFDWAAWTIADPADADSKQALRYEQFIAVLVNAVQQLTLRVRELESRVGDHG